MTEATRQRWLAIAALCCLAGLSFTLFLPRLGLLHDDWFYFHRVAGGEVPAIDAEAIRPLHGVPWRLAGLLFGERLAGYYLLLFALQGLAAWVLYRLACRYAASRAALALAALALVYPADASHLWLSSLPLRLSWLLALAALLLAERARDTDSRPRMLAAVALALAALGLYELPFVVMLAWPFLARVLEAPWKRWQWMLWALVPALYVAWRWGVLAALGASTVVNTGLAWEPAHVLERLLLRVPYNLFVEGWWIGARELLLAAGAAAGAVLVLALYAAAWKLLRETGPEPPPVPVARRVGVALALIAAGIAPVVPTTYWIGRAAGTYGGRILAATVPGAALLVLVIAGALVPWRAFRAAVLGALFALAFGFHYNTQRLAAENWRVQQEVMQSVRAGFAAWPPGSFLVLLNLPSNRLGFDTPFGLGGALREAYGGADVSGVGISSDRGVAEILRCRGSELLVHEGELGRAPLDRVVVIDWRGGAPARINSLAPVCGPREARSRTGSPR